MTKESKHVKECSKCKGQLKTGSPREILCEKCIKRFPQCFACGIVIGGSRYSYIEDSAVNLNGHIICGTCADRLRRYGFLSPYGGNYLLPDGGVYKQVDGQPQLVESQSRAKETNGKTKRKKKAE